MKVTLLLLALFCVGCGDKFETITGSDQLPIITTSVKMLNCEPFDLDWKIDRDNSGPWITIRTSVEELDVEEKSGDPWQEYSTLSYFKAHYYSTYQVRGRVGRCWSNYHGFVTVGPNGNFSGDNKPSPTPGWSDYRCIRAVDFLPGMSEILTFNTPIDTVLLVTAVTFDVGHPQLGEEGQAETVMIGGFGSTQDIPDNETEASSTWSTALPVFEVRVTAIAGSLHSETLGHGAVCVAIEEQ